MPQGTNRQVMVIDEVVLPQVLADILRNHGIAVLNAYTRPGVRQLSKELLPVLRVNKAKEEAFAHHDLEIESDPGMPNWTSVFFFSPVYEFDRAYAVDLITRAVKAWTQAGRAPQFLHVE